VRVLAIVHQADAGPGVFAEAVGAAGHELEVWMPPSDPVPDHADAYGAVMVFGGSMNVDQEERFAWLQPEKALLGELIERETPLLGVCLGSQLVAEAAGGGARRAARPEIGWFPVEVEEAGAGDPLLGPLAPRFTAFGWHSYEFFPPAGATVLARSDAGIQAARYGERSWGIQFHAEVDRPTVERWIARYDADEDAVGIGLDPQVLRAETEPRLDAWNELGRQLCARFLDAVATPA
jgi:GMP synthase (glutamine-hydrolysing)